MERKSKRCPGTNMDGPGEDVAIDNNDKQVVFVGEDEITVHDVVLGRGSRIALYPGNENFRRLVALYRDEYHSTKRNSKHIVSAEVIHHIASLDPPGRFLTMMCDEAEEDTPQGKQGKPPQGPVSYTLTPFRRSVEKVSQALREKPKTRNAVIMMTVTSSSTLVEKKNKNKKMKAIFHLRRNPVKKKKKKTPSKAAAKAALPVAPVTQETTNVMNRFGRIIRIKTVVQNNNKQPRPTMHVAPRRVTDPWRYPPPRPKQEEDFDVNDDDDVNKKEPVFPFGDNLSKNPQEQEATIIDVVKKTPTTKEHHEPPMVLVSYTLDEEVDIIISDTTTSTSTTTTTTAAPPPSDKDVDYTSWSFYQHQQKEQDAQDKTPPFFTEHHWMLGAASDLSSGEQLEVSTSFPSYDVVNAHVGVVAAVKKDKKTPPHPYSPDTVMDDIVSLDEEEEPCDFEPPRRSLFFAAKNDVEQQQQQQQTVNPNTMMLSSGAVSNMGTTTTTKHDDSTFIFSSYDDNIVIQGQDEDEEDDDDVSLWPLDTIIMEEDDARFLPGLSCYSFVEPSQSDFSRSLFSAEDNDVNHHHHHHNEDDGGGNITETENLFFQYWTSTNQVGASNDMMMG